MVMFASKLLVLLLSSCSAQAKVATIPLSLSSVLLLAIENVRLYESNLTGEFVSVILHGILTFIPHSSISPCRSVVPLEKLTI